jgi:histidyl-tRNA synthetase
MLNSTPPKGMRDLLPKEVELRNYVINTIVSIYQKYGFSQVETPCTEDIKLLTSGDGGDNEKLIFKILKRGEKLNLDSSTKESDIIEYGLRYDLTVPLCRFYANNKAKLPQNFKVIQIGSVWRAERPQKGRFRQFTQCDIDIIGTATVVAEIELILATSEALSQLNFEDFRVRISDRRILEALAGYCNFDKDSFGKVFIILDKLDKIGLSGVKTELENANFGAQSIEKFIQIVSQAVDKSITIQNINDLLPNIPEKVVEDLQLTINTIKQQAKSNYSIEFDLSLVRGMGYYTGQIFEIEIAGYKSSIAGGGRYDKMIGKILQGKEDIPACGFSIGFERVITILEERKFKVPNSNNKIAILYHEDLDSYDNLLSQVKNLRNKNNIVSIEIRKKDLRKQLDKLKELDFKSFAIYELNQPLVLKEFGIEV